MARFSFYRDRVLPLLLAQGDQEFDIAIWCNPLHAERFKALSEKIVTFSATYTPREGLFADFTDWRNVSGLKQYEIQMGLDSDDFVNRDYVATVRSLCVGEKSMLVSFQPQIAHLRRKEIGKMRQYHEKSTSAFFALYYPRLKGFKFAYCDSHTQLWRYVDSVALVPEGHCCATANGMNDSTVWSSRRRGQQPENYDWVKRLL